MGLTASGGEWSARRAAVSDESHTFLVFLVRGMQGRRPTCYCLERPLAECFSARVQGGWANGDVCRKAGRLHTYSMRYGICLMRRGTVSWLYVRVSGRAGRDAVQRCGRTTAGSEGTRMRGAVVAASCCLDVSPLVLLSAWRGSKDVQCRRRVRHRDLRQARCQGG